MARDYLSRRVHELKPSGIRKFFDIAASMQDVISLGIGEPDFDTPQAIIEAGVRALRAGKTHYTSNHGLLALREAIASQLEHLYGVHYDPQSEILVTVGCSEALYLAANALLEPGDAVLMLTPCFVSYQAEVFLAGGVAIEVPLRMQENFDLNLKDLQAAITPTTKAVLINFPNNPTGAVASRARLLELAQLAEQHDMLVISDEIYDRLVYGVQHTCFAALPGMRERTVLIGGFSKDYAMTGWRIGFAAAPKPILDGLVKIHQYTVMSAPTVSQYAAIEAISNSEQAVEEMRAQYDQRRKLIVEGLNQIGLPTVEPRGAFYAFAQVAGTGLDDKQFAKRLLESKKVAVVPGSAFGKGGEGFVRCSYAAGIDKIEEALERMQQFVQEI